MQRLTRRRRQRLHHVLQRPADVALRPTRLDLVGSGQGSVAAADILAELPRLAATLTDGSLRIEHRELPLSQVREAWATPPSGPRVALVPDAG